MLRAVDVSKSYGDVVALREASLAVDEGQIVSLLGRNGAGKTTLLSIVAGLLRADGGSVEIDGFDAAAEPDRAAKRLGIAPQETGIYPVLSVRHNLEFFGELAGMDRPATSRRAGEVAEQLDLTELLDRKASTLSGGEARRLHTACALVHRPRLLMLDEPTVGADVATRAHLIDAVRQLAADGAAVVYTTHYLPEVEALAADVVIIDDGRILARGTRDELVAEHQLQGLRLVHDGRFPVERFADLSPVVVDEETVRLNGRIDMAQLLQRLGPESDCLMAVESLKPDLETVFLAVTGGRLERNDS